MIKFDRIKLVTPIDNMLEMDTTKFKATSQNDIVLNYVYKSSLTRTIPSTLYIRTDEQQKQVVLEFSAKILGDNYPKLICSETISQCFENINNTGIIRFNTPSVINNSKVISCDVTADVQYTMTNEVRKTLQNNVGNPTKWTTKLHKNQGISFAKDLKTKNQIERLIIYDKTAEIFAATNKDFVSTVTNPVALFDYFQGKTRFETNFKSLNKIREHLGITDTSLRNVLYAKANPLLSVFNNIIETPQSNEVTGKISYNNIEEYRMYLILADNNFDIKLVKQKLKTVYSEKTNLRSILMPYKLMIEHISGSDSFEQIKIIKNKLINCFTASI